MTSVSPTLRPSNRPTAADLVEFLRARFAEDEAAAQAAVTSQFFDEGRWMARSMARSSYVISETKEDVTGQDATMTEEVAAHIAHWDPARVLAEIAAKRQALETLDLSFSDYYVGEISEEVALALAKPYADHPDYREEWRRR